LIGAGADVNAVNLKGQNPMGLLAELYGEERGDILGMLVAAGAEASEPMGTDRLIAMLSETHKEVRCYAAERLGERRGQEVFDALVRSLEDPYVAAAAARSLGKLGDRRAVGPLCACIKTAAAAKNTELELRRGIVFAWEQAAEAACDAIAVLAPQESFVHMSELLQDRDTAYYGAACLAKRPDTRAELVLSRCVSDLAIPFSARAKAAEALATLGEASAVPVLLSALKSLPGPSAWQLRQSLKDSLFKLGDRRLVSTLLGLFGDQKAAVRGTAMELASRFVAKSAAPGASIDEGARSSRSEGAADELREDVVSALIGALGNDPSYSVRVIAAKGLGDLEAQDAVGPLMVAVERHSDLPYRTVSDDELIVGGSSYVLACCAKALGTIGDPSAVPVLQKALERWEEEGMDEVTDPLRDAITALTEKK
jgi:HEAT repeat protein